MKNNFKLIFLITSLGLIISIFTGCGALSTAIEKRNLEVQSRMSESIFLEPVGIEDQIVYVRVRNTTDKELEIEDIIKKSFEAKGFRITKNPNEAKFMVQANLLQVGKSDAQSARRALESGFGGVLVGVGVAAASNSSATGYGVAGLVGGLVGSVANAMVKDVYYTMITDVEIRQRPLNGENIEQIGISSSKQGTSGSVNQNIKTSNVKWKIYRTRVVSTANKVNLEFDEAKPELIKGLSRSLSGLL